MAGCLYLNLEGGSPRRQELLIIPWCSHKHELIRSSKRQISSMPALEMKKSSLLLLNKMIQSWSVSSILKLYLQSSDWNVEEGKRRPRQKRLSTGCNIVLSNNYSIHCRAEEKEDPDLH
ncbi:conserved hypothetical protein [Ricinus communis]|uniref:Uncharacterized protein n=1 Tax=Ricinus communis TaxID=3988 RepID=B9SXX2_RICCO|nr:conserved hypothetical protein [Ricinus communis]